MKTVRADVRGVGLLVLVTDVPGPSTWHFAAALRYVTTFARRYRYTLTMSDHTVLGQRRAAQRLGAAVLKEVGAGAADAAIAEALTACCGTLVGEIP